MSELKVYVMPLKTNIFGKTIVGQSYYSKYEADKVIAEKDKEIQRLENLCESYRIDCDNLDIREANAYKEIERDNKQLRRQKYRRCLAMARWCENAILGWMGWMGWKESYSARERYLKVKLFEKWHKHWLKLAEKYKEAK